MAPESHVFDLADVKEMVTALPVDTSLRIGRITNALRRGEVVFWLVETVLMLSTVNRICRCDFYKALR